MIIFAFSPFFFGNTSINEYLRPLVVVLALALLPWLLCLTVTPLLATTSSRSRHTRRTRTTPNAANPETRFYRVYRRAINAILDHKLVFFGAMATLLTQCWFRLYLQQHLRHQAG